MGTIMHVDMDAFFAAVEILDNPHYAGKPVIVGGHKDSKRGVVSTCSYEARKYGIHSAMPITKAVALCPHGIFIPGRMKRYQEVSTQVHAIFPQFSPIVEPLSVDEAFLDMTGCEHFYSGLEHMGQALKDEIRKQTGLTASVGIAPNKFLAKLASDWKKPDGLFVIYPHEVQSFLHDLPVSRIWGVGKKSEQALHQLGLYHIRDILPHSEQWLTDRLGSLGTHIYYLARGIDNRAVETEQEAKSIGHEITFHDDQTSFPFLKSQLGQMAEKVGWRLRSKGLYARTVTIKVRFHNFRTITRSHTVQNPFCDDDTIYFEALHLLEKIKLEPVRLLGVSVTNFTTDLQLSLFEESDQRQKLSKVMDRINRQFTQGTITKGRTLINDQE